MILPPGGLFCETQHFPGCALWCGCVIEILIQAAPGSCRHGCFQRHIVGADPVTGSTVVPGKLIGGHVILLLIGQLVPAYPGQETGCQDLVDFSQAVVGGPELTRSHISLCQRHSRLDLEIVVDACFKLQKEIISEVIKRNGLAAVVPLYHTGGIDVCGVQVYSWTIGRIKSQLGGSVGHKCTIGIGIFSYVDNVTHRQWQRDGQSWCFGTDHIVIARLQDHIIDINQHALIVR